MVLASKIEDYFTALWEKPVLELLEIPENSIALISNVRVGDNSANDPLTVYSSTVRFGLAQGLHVYITCHSSQARQLCSGIKAVFADDERVILLEYDHSCMEFNVLVKKFCFVIASRFHAIVYALKNGVPCVVLGWTTKYMDLMKLFFQEWFVFDLRQSLEISAMVQAVREMGQVWQTEAEVIRTALPELQKENVFDFIKKA